MQKYILAAVLAFMAGGAQAATLIVSAETGQWLAASGVLVDGWFYDVGFIDGSCVMLYSGCDQDTDFTFSSAADDGAASQALLDQVFLDGPSGNFASVPSLTNGCGPGAPNGCILMIPYQFSITSLGNRRLDFEEACIGIPSCTSTSVQSAPIATDILLFHKRGWARWSPFPSPPPPSLMGAT
jgi:hypothetical protein